MMRHDGVIFDLDGTLVDTAPDLTGALNYILAGLGRSAVDEALVRPMIGQGALKIIEAGLMASGGIDGHDLQALRRPFLDHYEAHTADASCLFHDAALCLDRLAAGGVALSVATNKAEGLARLVLSGLQIHDRFRTIIGGDTLNHAKPHQAPLLACQQAMGSQHPIMIGDTRTDLDAAYNASIPCVLVTFGYSPEPINKLNPLFFADDFEHITDYILSHD